MTAEIAIMNKMAVALASDSAVTMTEKKTPRDHPKEKIFSSANKLFALSKYHPVGIMVYGSANFMEIPWETIIKVYRNNFLDKNKEKFDTLEEYAKDFVEFLDNGNPLFPNSEQDYYVYGSISAYFVMIKEQIQKKVDSILTQRRRITKKRTQQIVSERIKLHYDRWIKTDNIPSIPKRYNDEIIDKYEELIEEAIKIVFEQLPISPRPKNWLKKIAGSLFSKYPEGIKKGEISGVVIAGFGENDIFPSLVSLQMEGIANNRLKYRRQQDLYGKIDFKNNASIIPFAQREMVDIFMEGIDPTYRNVEETYLSKIFQNYAGIIVNNLQKYTDKEKRDLNQKLVSIGEKILKDRNDALRRYRAMKYISPVVKVVSVLPKDELAIMAESLVSLTSFKRKVTLESETVAGPIDVAVISKGDGFIWIKRKHYFKKELNPQFFANYYKEVQDE